jgi:hypothetical protein
MNSAQKSAIERAMIDFIIRTAENDKAASEAVTVLPSVVSSLVELEKTIHPC